MDIEQIKAELRSLELLRNRLDVATYQKLKTDLERQLTESDSKEPLPPNVDNSNININDVRSVEIQGDASHVTIITGDGNRIIRSVADVEPEILFKAYYRSLAQECSRLPLGEVDPQFAQPGAGGKVELTAVYTDLDVVSPPRKDEEEERYWGLKLARGDGSERTPLLEAICADNTERVTLIGDAGSGKTTFVNYLTFCLAQAALNNHSSDLPEGLAGLLPIRLILRTAARQILPDTDTGQPDLLWQALHIDIVERLGKQAGGRLQDHLQARLLNEGGLFLLDGLDEVPEALERRSCLLDSIQQIIASLPANSKIILTARPYAYADPKWHLPDFQVLALAPFNQPQIDHFVARWYQAVCPVMSWDSQTSKDRAQQLSQALQDRSYLADLGSRPLLLTLMATLHSSWGKLPDDRADLYEASVNLLLARWQRRLDIKDAKGQLLQEPGITQALGLAETKIRNGLEQLAFQTHSKQQGEKEETDAPADIPYAEVLEVFTPLLPRDVNPQEIIDYLENRSGLLISRRDNVFAFPHRSFQEYLAACYWFSIDQGQGNEIQTRLMQDSAWWREVFLLGIGKIPRSNIGSAVLLLNILLPDGPEKTKRPKKSHWQLAILVAEALLELKLSEQPDSSGFYKKTIARIRNWLIHLIEKSKLSLRERARAGDLLGYLDDTRPGAGVSFAKSHGLLADIQWIYVPKGQFTMGSDDNDEQADANEKPAHSLTLPAFKIACYPVTNAQYRLFIEANGYHEREWWSEEGWAWRQGAEVDLSNIQDKRIREIYQNHLAQRPTEKRQQPFWWNNIRWSAPNRPVVGISWYEALAYTGWLNNRLSAAGKLKTHEKIILPNEAQWEKAACGRENNGYPWGNDWVKGMANTSELELNETCSVGLFSSGVSCYGCHDIAGNVWEWTSSRWGKDFNPPEYSYPYCSSDDREDLSGDLFFRVLRGGSWGGAHWNARCAVRLGSHPADLSSNLGFRLVLSLAEP